MLRVLGTPATLQRQMLRQAEADLGIRIRYIVRDGTSVQRTGVMQPDAYDVYDQWFHSIDCLWPAHAIQPINLSRIKYWAEVNSLPRTGKLGESLFPNAGSAPADRLYVQGDNSLGREPTGRVTMLPTVHNVDSFVYLPDALPNGFEPNRESWDWLLNPALSGKVALQADAAIGAIDAALAVQASGQMSFGDIGNMTITEINCLIDILISYKRRGQFAGFWSSFAEAAHLMTEGKVVIQSVWEPIRVELKRAGLPFRLATPIEGYRGWYGGLSISRAAAGRQLDVAYDYLNWWLSGWAGASMARQGFYISNPDRSRDFLTEDEWDYWYDGRAAQTVLPGPNNRPLISINEQRNGGSYATRMSRVAVWNSMMDEHNYLVRRWNEFMNA